MWLHLPANLDRFKKIYPDILVEKRSISSRVRVWEIQLVAALLFVFLGKCRLQAKGSLCRNGCGLAYPRCEKSFSPVALCLAEIEPFYWHSDTSNTVIGFVQ